MDFTLQDKELLALRKIQVKDSQLRTYLSSNAISSTATPKEHLIYIQDLANLLGNIKNLSSEMSCILAREFLQKNFDAEIYDSCLKPQGARGIDIECFTYDRKRIVGEIKTTVPYGGKTLGAQQATSFHKDLKRLSQENAEHKFFFILNEYSKDAANYLISRSNYDSSISVINLLKL